MMEYHDLIEEYLKTRTDLKSATIKNYRNALTRAVKRVNYKPITEISEEEINDAICYLNAGSHQGRVVEQFFHWCQQREPVPDAQALDWNSEFNCLDDSNLRIFSVPSSTFPLLDGVACLDGNFVRGHYLQEITHYRRAIINDARSETEHQISVMDWTRRPDVQARYPELEYIYHTANEISGSDKMAHEDLDRIRKERYQMGVQAGIPDLCLPVARGKYHALYIELKSLKPSAKPSPEQLRWQQWLRDCGNVVEICYGDVDAINLIINYLELNSCDSL